jgi:hypothetical protein
VQEILVIKDEPQLAPCQVPRYKHDDHGPRLDDSEPIVASFELHAEFQEDEREDLNTRECLLVHLVIAQVVGWVGVNLGDPRGNGKDEGRCKEKSPWKVT